MNRRYRKTVIAGNWKMNKTAEETRAYAETLKAILPKTKWCDIILCVPYVNIPAAQKAFKDTRVSIGAQNVHWDTAGAYTGEISAAMLNDIGVKYVVIGHSERRLHAGENDTMVSRKVRTALAAGLRPIICVGATLDQREIGVTLDLLDIQVKTALAGVTAEQMRHVIIAHEPVWAIGTGLTATAEQANEAGEEIRTVIRKLYGARVARSVTILYGGSMTPANARELLAEPDVDGGLVGGSSLEPETFLEIINAANQE